MMVSRPSSHSGRRLWPLSRIRRTFSSFSYCSDRKSTSTRGTMMWRTSSLIMWKTFSVISYSRSLMLPLRADSERMLRISSAE